MSKIRKKSEQEICDNDVMNNHTYLMIHPSIIIVTKYFNVTLSETIIIFPYITELLHY